MRGALGLLYVIDAVLLGIFASQHSGMVRSACKQWWTERMGPAIEHRVLAFTTKLAPMLLLPMLLFRQSPRALLLADPR